MPPVLTRTVFVTGQHSVLTFLKSDLLQVQSKHKTKKIKIKIKIDMIFHKIHTMIEGREACLGQPLWAKEMGQ